MDWKRGFGIGLMFFGIYLVIINGTITGNVIGFGDENIFGMFGIIIFFIGILFIFSSMTLERKVKSSPKLKVYQSVRNLGNRRNIKYFINDTHKVFTSLGEIELEDFKEAYEAIKNDQELRDVARETYGFELMDIVTNGDEKSSETAMKFLEVLYEKNIPKIEEEKNNYIYHVNYDINDDLSMKSQGINGRLKNAVDNMEDVLMRGGDPGIRSHSMGGRLNHVFEARAGVHGGPRIYYKKDPRNKIITILGYSIKNNSDKAQRKLMELYGK